MVRSGYEFFLSSLYTNGGANFVDRVVSILRQDGVGDDAKDSAVVEKDISDLIHRDFPSRYCLSAVTILISNDDDKFVSGPSTCERFEDISGYKL